MTPKEELIQLFTEFWEDSNKWMDVEVRLPHE